MPAGMFLKSEGVNSNRSDPDGSFTLAQHYTLKGPTSNDQAAPISLDTVVN